MMFSTDVIYQNLHEDMVIPCNGDYDEKLQYVLEALKWFEKKHRFYEIKDELQVVITKRNLEIYHLKKKLSEIMESYYTQVDVCRGCGARSFIYDSKHQEEHAV